MPATQPGCLDVQAAWSDTVTTVCSAAACAVCCLWPTGRSQPDLLHSQYMQTQVIKAPARPNASVLKCTTFTIVLLCRAGNTQWLHEYLQHSLPALPQWAKKAVADLVKSKPDFFPISGWTHVSQLHGAKVCNLTCRTCTVQLYCHAFGTRACQCYQCKVISHQMPASSSYHNVHLEHDFGTWTGGQSGRSRLLS